MLGSPSTPTRGLKHLKTMGERRPPWTADGDEHWVSMPYAHFLERYLECLPPAAGIRRATEDYDRLGIRPVPFRRLTELACFALWRIVDRRRVEAHGRRARGAGTCHFDDAASARGRHLPRRASRGSHLLVKQNRRTRCRAGRS